MSLRFKNNELERSYAAHYRSHRARSDWMGMLLDAVLWAAGFVPNYRQGRLSPGDFNFAPLILASCLGIAYLSRFHTNFYHRHRNLIAVCWRLSAVLWPTYLRLMQRTTVRVVQKYPIMAVIFGSSLLTNIITTVCMPLVLPNSFFINVLVSSRQLYEQCNVCNRHEPTCTTVATIAPKFWDVLALLNPFGLGSQVPSVTVLPPQQQCSLVYLTSEIAVLAISWSVAWCIERQIRIRYLGQMNTQELERKGGKQELFDLMLYDLFGVGVRLTCFVLFGISLMWIGVLANHSRP